MEYKKGDKIKDVTTNELYRFVKYVGINPIKIFAKRWSKHIKWWHYEIFDQTQVRLVRRKRKFLK